jgi:hypothetical protein
VQRIWFLAIALALTAACQSDTDAVQPRRPSNAGWRQVESWKGRGSTQTDWFDMPSYSWRIRWETKNAPPGKGRLHVEAHSGDSGRLLADAINVTGNGRGIAPVTVDPHRFYLVVDSSDVDWSLTVEQPVGVP